MKIIIKTKNIEPTESLSDFINEKFSSLKKFIYPVKYREAVISPKAKLFNGVNILKREEGMCKTLAEVFVEVEKETKHHNKGEIFLAEASLKLPGKNLMALARSDDLLNAITKARNELKSEINKYKSKEIEGMRRRKKQTKKEISF